SLATDAQLWRETTCARIFASLPSEASANRSKTARAIASSSTLSPRNSSRSYDSARSSGQDACVKTCSSRGSGSSAIRRPSPGAPSLLTLLLVVRDDVVDRLADGRE